MAEDDNTPGGEVTDDGESLKDLRDAAARSQANAAAALAAQRELAFVRAGLDVEDPIVRHVMGSYEGETTVDAVKEHAKSLGLERLTKPVENGDGTPEGGQQDQGNEGREAQRKALLEDGTPPASTDTEMNPHRKGLLAFQSELDRGVTRDDASGAYFAELFDAAARGDKRVLVGPDNPMKAEQRSREITDRA